MVYTSHIRNIDLMNSLGDHTTMYRDRKRYAIRDEILQGRVGIGRRGLRTLERAETQDVR